MPTASKKKRQASSQAASQSQVLQFSVENLYMYITCFFHSGLNVFHRHHKAVRDVLVGDAGLQLMGKMAVNNLHRSRMLSVKTKRIERFEKLVANLKLKLQECK